MEGHMPWAHKTCKLVVRNLRLHFLLASVPLEWNANRKVVQRPYLSCLKRTVFYIYFAYNAFNVYWVGQTFVRGLGKDAARPIKSLALDLFLLAAMILWLTVGYNVAAHADEYVDALNATFCYSPRQICE